MKPDFHARTFVTTDTHGELEKLKSALKQAGFDFESDTLIHLGDCIDRGPDSAGVINLLLTIKNLIAIRGNHDAWMLEFINTGVHPGLAYFSQTIASYQNDATLAFTPNLIPATHLEFFQNQVDFYVDEQNRCFCHAGIELDRFIGDQDSTEFYWNRVLVKKAMSAKSSKAVLKDLNNFRQIFIGHTPTCNWKEGGNAITTPIYAAQVINLDTGAAYGYKLSLIDITTDDHILYQS